MGSAFTRSGAPDLVLASVINKPLLVAAGGLVVVIAIVLVFIMVLRNNGDSRKTARGIGYDAHQGPYGQPQAPAGPPEYGRQQPMSYGDEPPGFGMPGGPSNGQPGWGQGGYGEPMGVPGASSQGRRGAAPGAGRWGEMPAASPSGGPAFGGPPQAPWQDAPAAAAPGWGGQPEPQQQAQGGWPNPAANPSGGWPQPAPSTPQSAGPTPQPGSGWGQAQPSVGPQPGAPWGGQASQGEGGWGAAAAQPAYGGAPQPGGAYPAATHAAVLVVRQGKEPGRTFDLRKGRISIGRSRDSDIFLEDLAVSRLHTSILRDDHGSYIIRDENSANGTFVNGQRVMEQPLSEGDEVQVGQTVLTFAQR